MHNIERRWVAKRRFNRGERVPTPERRRTDWRRGYQRTRRWGGGTNPTCPDTGCPPAEEPSLADDMDRDTIPPADCFDPNNDRWEKVYCRATLPDTSQLRKTHQALNRITERGEACAILAQKGRELLASGQITFFAPEGTDAGGYGHRNTGIQLDAGFPAYYDYPDSRFEKVLVHEIDHVLGGNTSGLKTGKQTTLPSAADAERKNQRCYLQKQIAPRTALPSSPGWLASRSLRARKPLLPGLAPLALLPWSRRPFLPRRSGTSRPGAKCRRVWIRGLCGRRPSFIPYGRAICSCRARRRSPGCAPR